jgi:prevent-host-death family protein
MREIGVRELKASLSETLRAVSRGQQVRVTLRGRPVADIVPAGTSSEESRLDTLVAEGRLVAPTGVPPTRAPKLVRANQSASAFVLSDRDAER